PRLAKVRQRERAGAAQRRGDEEEQREVAGGEPHRIPEHVDPVFEDQPRDAEERRGGEVFTADRGGVPGGADHPGGDQEVGGGAGQFEAVEADGDRDERDGDDRRQDVRVRRGAHRSGCRTRAAKSCSLRSASLTKIQPMPTRKGYAATPSSSHGRLIPNTFAVPTGGATANSSGSPPSPMATTTDRSEERRVG